MEQVNLDITIKAVTLRGSVINDTIYIERLIDEFLCSHFCDDNIKKKQLFELLISTKKITY